MIGFTEFVFSSVQFWSIAFISLVILIGYIYYQASVKKNSKWNTFAKGLDRLFWDLVTMLSLAFVGECLFIGYMAIKEFK